MDTRSTVRRPINSFFDIPWVGAWWKAWGIQPRTAVPSIFLPIMQPIMSLPVIGLVHIFMEFGAIQPMKRMRYMLSHYCIPLRGGI